MLFAGTAVTAPNAFFGVDGPMCKRGTDIGLGIGIEAGYATIGPVGLEGRHEYAVLGSVANLASRLSSAATAGQILIGPRVFAAVEDMVSTAPVGDLELRGFGRPVPTYEVHATHPST
jgi:adenylate cyclase